MKKLKDISEFRTPGEVAQDAALKAPNGHKSMLPDKLWHMVRTNEFKQWFGDWENDPENASKIVDKNGEPMVVYHGTPSYGFKEFLNDYKLPRATSNETNNLGVWFTNDRRVAEEFMFKSDKGGIYEVFINLRNPKVFKPGIFNEYEIDAIDKNISDLEKEKYRLGWSYHDMTPEKRDRYTEIQRIIDELYDKQILLKHSVDSFEQFMNYRDKYTEYIDGVKGKIGHWVRRMCAMNSAESNKKLIKEFTDNQHDGMAIIDTQYDAPRKNARVSQFCVFDTGAIKSVDNNGRFSTDTKNIYESSAIYKQNNDKFMQHLELFEDFNNSGSNLKITNDQDIKDVADYMVKAVKKKWDLKDLIHYFEKDNEFDYKLRSKIWDEMNANTMPKTYDNIHKLLVAIIDANKK